MVDCIVIGGGPAGLFSAYYAKARGLHTILLEADYKLGGRLHLYGHMALYDVPANFGIEVEQYRQLLVEQFRASGVPAHLQTKVLKVEKIGAYFRVYSEHETYTTKTVIIATGAGFLQMKQLPVSAAVQPFLRYHLTEVPTEHNRFAVVGANPMAIDWALQLHKAGHEVYLFTEQLERIQPLLREPLLASSIYIEETQNSRSLKVVDNQLYYREQVVENVYVHIGTTKSKIEFSPSYKSIDNGITSTEGLFIAGDIRYELGKMKLIIGAIHDAMQAANAAKQFVDCNAHYQPVVSTHDPIFKEWDL